MKNFEDNEETLKSQALALLKPDFMKQHWLEL